MIGIILISHAHIASETKSAVEHILGKQGYFETVDIPNSDVLSGEQDRFNLLLESVNNGHGVLVMVDLFGATPCNFVLEASEPNHIEVVVGFNLPAVIKAITLRQDVTELKTLAALSVRSGQQYLQVTNEKNISQELLID